MINTSGNAQEALYKATYNFKQSHEVARRYQGISELYFNDSLSLSVFIDDKDKSKMRTPGVIIVASPDKEGYPILTNLNKQKQILKLTKFRNQFVVTDTILPLKWELKTAKRTINGFNCYKATSRFGGRDYVAWYSPEIPFPFGPIRFHGLPGLIIHLKSKDGVIDISLIEFGKVKDNYTIKPPKDGAKVSWEEYVDAAFRIYDKMYSTSGLNMNLRTYPIAKDGKYDLLGRYYETVYKH